MLFSINVYAEKIFNDHVYRNVSSIDFPFLSNTMCPVNISIVKGKITITPQGCEDLVLMKYHYLPDRIIDLSRFVASIRAPVPKSTPLDIPPARANIKFPPLNYANRLRKLNYIADDYFIDYYDAIRLLRKSFENKRGISSKCAFYARGFTIDLPIKYPRLVLRQSIYPGLTDAFVFSLTGKKLHFGAAARPLNACAAFSLFSSVEDIRYALLHFARRLKGTLSSYKYRILISTIRAAPLDVRLPRTDHRIFYKRYPIVLNVYDFHDRYDAEKELSELLLKKSNLQFYKV